MATIHMDPVAVNDPEVKELKLQVADLAKEVLDAITIHDFRVVKGDTHTNLIFDMVVPFSCKCTDREMADMVADKIKEKLGNNYYAVIDVDRANH